MTENRDETFISRLFYRSRGMWAIICEKSAIDGAAVQEVVG